MKITLITCTLLGIVITIFNFRGRGREEAVDKRGGVFYKDEQIKNMLELAEELNVKPPKIVESQ